MWYASSRSSREAAPSSGEVAVTYEWTYPGYSAHIAPPVVQFCAVFPKKRYVLAEYTTFDFTLNVRQSHLQRNRTSCERTAPGLMYWWYTSSYRLQRKPLMRWMAVNGHSETFSVGYLIQLENVSRVYFWLRGVWSHAQGVIEECVFHLDTHRPEYA